MIYTLGNKTVYDKYISEDKDASKAIGGSVWKNLSGVKKYLLKNPMNDFDIYGVDADWENDTKINPMSKSWKDLTRPCKLIILKEQNV